MGGIRVPNDVHSMRYIMQIRFKDRSTFLEWEKYIKNKFK